MSEKKRFFQIYSHPVIYDTGITVADERHVNLTQGKQELLMVKDKVGRPKVSLG